MLRLLSAAPVRATAVRGVATSARRFAPEAAAAAAAASTAVPAASAIAAVAASSSSSAAAAAAPRPIRSTLTPRLLALSSNVAANSRPQRNPRTGYWNAPKLSAQTSARLRKTDLFNGGTAAQFERVRLRRVEPVVLKGKKREKEIIDRKRRIVAAMVDMEQRIEDHHKAERARRVRPTFFQMITGKKPSGVIAAEEAAIKERKDKAKALEKARQAAKEAK